MLRWAPRAPPTHTASANLCRLTSACKCSTQQLNLSGDQQEQIKPILENESQQMQALRSDTALSQQDRMSKMQAIRKDTASQIKPILNADQQTKYQEMMSHQGPRGGMAPAPQRQPQ